MSRARTALFASFVVVAACTSDPPVAVERSDSSSGELAPDIDRLPPDVGANAPGDDAVGDETGDDVDTGPAPPTTLTWSSCESYGIPSADILGTRGWECATLDAAMDPFDAEADAGEVELAITRHPATGERRGTILLNPGGPGGAGLPLAWGLRDELSPTLLRGFDVVSWDPRGVGRSTPRIDCDDDVPPGDVDFIERCVELTGTLSGFLAAPYSAADMESIRIALGEEQLDYLGYSYGALLGSTYASAHPDRVGAFVLDGATDPLVGTERGPFDDGFPSLADDGFEAAERRFTEICDATDACLFSLDAATVLADLAEQVPVLPTPDFDGPPERLDVRDYDDVIDGALIFAGEWELTATGLSDADLGDASALAAITARSSGSGEGDPAIGESDFSEANYMIYCADFGRQLSGQSFCDEMPVAGETLGPVSPVELDRNMLVIGTEFDPLTPGYHAAEFAEALGDATHIIWEGVGHTAYPGWTTCIDDAVDAQFLRRPVPDDGTRCAFLLGVDDDEALGDELFGHGDVESDSLLRDRLEEDLDDRTAECQAESLNQESDRVISHVILDVTSQVALDALEVAAAAC